MRAVKKNNIFSREVGEKANRMLKAKHENKRSAWAGFGVFGIIGWSVAVPTLAGAAFGNWLDKSHPQTFSWTLSLLIIGIMIGCIIAWNWINKEHKDMYQNREDKE